jgi:hypothetical protein
MNELTFSQAVTVLRRRSYVVRLAAGLYEITRADDPTVQLVDRVGLLAQAQALLQLDQVNGEQK